MYPAENTPCVTKLDLSESGGQSEGEGGVRVRVRLRVRGTVHTREMQRTIQSGMNVISQDQGMIPSSFRARNTNCRMFTAQNSSSSKDLRLREDNSCALL